MNVRALNGPHCVALINRIIELIRVSGQTTSIELSSELDISPKRIREYLYHMRTNMRVVRAVKQHKGRSKDCTIFTLGVEAVDEKADRDLEQIRITVKSWMSQPARRDPMVEALFGPAKTSEVTA